MREFYNYIDKYITHLLLINHSVKNEIFNIDKMVFLFREGRDLLKLDENELFNLIDYLVLSDSVYIKSKLHSIRCNLNTDNDIFLNNLLLDIKHNLLYLKDNLNNKIRNNNKLINRYYNLYNAFDNGSLVGEIVDFNLVNNIINDMGIGEEIKNEVINNITDNNLKIFNEKKIIAMKYYLTIEEFDLYNQFRVLINKKRITLKKHLSLNIDDIDFYNLNSKCILKLDEMNNVLEDIQASIELFGDSYDLVDKQTILKDKANYFYKLEMILDEYYDLEDELLDKYIFNNKLDNFYIDENSKPNIIYLTKGHKGNGNVLFLDSLKNIPLEYYSRLLEMITSMENYSQYDNLSSNKILTGKLKGLWERKAFKIRIYYKKLHNNDILILFCDTKKSNKTIAKDRYVEILSNWDDEINYIVDVMHSNSSNKEKEELIAINKFIHESVKEKLTIKGHKL